MWRKLCVCLLLRVGKSAAFLPHPQAIVGATAKVQSKMVAGMGLAPYTQECISLFNNMKTPASILTGALVGLGINAPLPLVNPNDENETRFEKTMRRMYSPIVVLSLSSELLSIMWSTCTVTVNKLIETNVEKAESVWHLLQRDLDLPWAGVNAHFTFGMFGFICLVGCRAYFHLRGGVLGRSCVGLSLSGLLLMVSILNRGIASGSGDGLRYGSSILHLWARYFALLVKQALRPGSVGALEIGSLVGLVVSSAYAARGLFLRYDESECDT